MIVLLIQNRDPYRKASLRFKSEEKALDHARRVIAPQVTEALWNLAMQDDPRSFEREMTELRDLSNDLFDPRPELWRGAIDLWADLAKNRNVGDTWVQWED